MNPCFWQTHNLKLIKVQKRCYQSIPLAGVSFRENPKQNKIIPCKNLLYFSRKKYFLCFCFSLPSTFSKPNREINKFAIVSWKKSLILAPTSQLSHFNPKKKPSACPSENSFSYQHLSYRRLTARPLVVEPLSAFKYIWILLWIIYAMNAFTFSAY